MSRTADNRTTPAPRPTAQAPAPLLLPARAGDTGCACKAPPPPDPLIEETVTVFDTEKTGSRYWDESTRTLHVVQTEYTDTVEVVYSGPTPPSEMKLYCNGTLKADLGGGTRWSHAITYTIPTKPYARNSAAELVLRELVTYAAFVNDWEFRCPQFKVTVRVYNPDQWKLSLKSPSFYKRQKLSEKWSSTDKKAGESNVSRRIETSSESWNPVGASAKIKNTIESTDIRSTPDSPINYASQSLSTSQSTSLNAGGTRIEGNQSASVEHSSAIANIVYSPGDGSYIAGRASVETLTTESRSSLSVSQGAGFPGSLGAATKYVSLTRNTTPFQVRALDLIGIALHILANLQKIKAAIKNNVPEIGWAWDMEFGVLEGTFDVTWGWKEHTDYGVYHQIGIGAELTLLELKGSIAAGVKYRGFRGQIIAEGAGTITLKIEGVNIKIGLDDEPTDRLLATVSGEIKASLSLDVRAGDVASIKAGARSTFLKCEAQLKWTSGDGAFIEGKTDFDGIELFATVKVKYLASQDVKFVVVDPCTIDTFRFPGKRYKEDDDFTSADQIATEVETAFETNIWPWQKPEFQQTVTYEEEYNKWFVGPRSTRRVTEEIKIDSKHVYRLIAAKIWQASHRLEMSRRVIEGLVLGLRADMTRDGSTIELGAIESYLRSAEFARRLTDAECPVKRAILDHGLA